MIALMMIFDMINSFREYLSIITHIVLFFSLLYSIIGLVSIYVRYMHVTNRSSQSIFIALMKALIVALRKNLYASFILRQKEAHLQFLTKILIKSVQLFSSFTTNNYLDFYHFTITVWYVCMCIKMSIYICAIIICHLTLI